MQGPSWKVGIVGCGRIAGLLDHPDSQGPPQTHAQAFWRHPHFKMEAVVESAQDRLRRFKETWQVPRGYVELQSMLKEERLDVVSITSPNEFHFLQAMEILQLPHPPRILWIEKPICLTEKETLQLLELFQGHPTRIIVNHTRRFDPAHQRLAEFLKAKPLGRLVRGRVTTYGGWINNGVHQVDTLRMLFGEEPQLISSTFSGPGRAQDADLEVTLRVQAGVISIETFPEFYFKLFESDFRFEKGRVRLLEAGAQMAVEKVEVNGRGERVLKPVEGFPIEGLVDPLSRAVEAMDRCLQGEDSFLKIGVDLEEACRTMKILWQAQEMAKEEAGLDLVRK